MGEPQPNRASSWAKRLSRRTCILMAGPMLAVVVGYTIVKHVVVRSRLDAAEKELERELSRIRAKGEPLTLAELARPLGSDEENAAVILEKAFAKMDVSDPAIEDWKKCLEGTFEVYREKAEKALGLNGEALRLARQALLRPYCRFDLDYSEGYGLKLPHLTHLRDLARLSAAEALLRAHTGRIEDATESICHVLSLARIIDDDQFMISKLVQALTVWTGLDALKEVRTLSPITDESSHRLLICMGKLDLGQAMVDALIVERAAALSVMERTIEGKAPWPGADRGDGSLAKGLAKVVLLKDEARLLRLNTELVDAFRLPPWEALERFRTRLAKMDMPEGQMPFTNLLFPGTVPALLRLIRTWAYRDAAVLGLSCELHRSAHGEYPDTLDALAPEFLPSLPPDPFTGEPFVYRKRADGKGFIVYSVGENLEDDGGVEDEKSGKDDISWERKPPERSEEAAAAK